MLLLRLLAQQLDTLFALHQVRGIIAFVKLNVAQINLGNAVYHVVQELAVVAYHNYAARIAAQEALKPLHAFKVKVVGGLVKQQHFGVAGKQLRQRNAHLPTAGKIGGHALHVVFAEAQAEQHRAHARFKQVTTHSLILVARTAISGELLLARVFAQ